ncbi:Unknown protein sequence [Pseudomonas syringae pv. syringae]|nr:Unknown protein sequence [Pseudomonas syringae pv. syringae]
MGKWLQVITFAEGQRVHAPLVMLWRLGRDMACRLLAEYA